MRDLTTIPPILAENADLAGSATAPRSQIPSRGSSVLADLNIPVFLMSAPLLLSAHVPNNILMAEMSSLDREIDLDRALTQFMDLYCQVTHRCLVYLLPSISSLQDQAYVSNLGCVLENNDENTFVVSKCRSLERKGEASVGMAFFNHMGLPVCQPPDTFDGEAVFFEGEADLKYLAAGVYIGAHGLRTSLSALKWINREFDVKIIPFLMTDPYLYHLDCCFFRLSSQFGLVCTSAASPTSLKEIERHAEIIEVSKEHARAGVTNGLLLGNELLCDSDVFRLPKSAATYSVERGKIDALEAVCVRVGLELKVLYMPEFYKSGARLSCLMLPLNRKAWRAA